MPFQVSSYCAILNISGIWVVYVWLPTRNTGKEEEEGDGACNGDMLPSNDCI